MSAHILLAGIALALVTGPLGCFVIWRRLAYFGDSLSHSALLGVAGGIALSIQTEFAILVVGLGFVGLLFFFQHRQELANDTILGILAHATLAIGILAMTLLGADDHDIHAVLIGTLDTITPKQALYTGIGAMIALGTLLSIWSGLVLSTVNENLAQAEGVSVKRHEVILMIIMALTVSIAIQMVGILLITSLLIIPAACARLLAKTPEHMAMGAALIGTLCVTVGNITATETAVAPGPLIVTFLTLTFVVLVLIARLFIRR